MSAIVAPTRSARSASSSPAYALIRSAVCKRAERPSVGNVRGEHDPLGRDTGKQLELIEHRERRRVIDDVRVIAQPRGEHPLVGDRRVREHEHDVGEAQREVGERVHPRHPPPGVDQDRDLRCLGDPPDRLGGRIAEAKRLRSRVKLDPARSEAEAALRLGHRIVGRVQPAVGIEASPGLLGPAQNPVIGHPVGGRAVGIVQRERAGPRGRGDLVEEREQAGEIERLPVLIPAQMRVRVDDDRAVRKQLTYLRNNRLGGRQTDPLPDPRRSQVAGSQWLPPAGGFRGRDLARRWRSRADRRTRYKRHSGVGRSFESETGAEHEPRHAVTGPGSVRSVADPMETL